MLRAIESGYVRSIDLEQVSVFACACGAGVCATKSSREGTKGARKERRIATEDGCGGGGRTDGRKEENREKRVGERERERERKGREGGRGRSNRI